MRLVEIFPLLSWSGKGEVGRSATVRIGSPCVSLYGIILGYRILAIRKLEGNVEVVVLGLNDAGLDWLRKAEMSGCWAWSDGITDENAKERSGISFFRMAPRDYLSKKCIEDAHEQGFRVLAYVGCTDTFADVTGLDEETGRLPFRKEIADALLVDKDGRFVNTLMDGTYRMHRFLTCANSRTYVSEMLAFLESVMDRGVDGLFIDNVYPSCEPCYGHNLHIGYSERWKTIIAESPNVKQYPGVLEELEKIPRHVHIYPDKDHNYAFLKFLEKIRDMVRSFGDDKAICINGGFAFVDPVDATMLESYICSWGWDGRNKSWSEIKKLAHDCEPYLKAGKRIVALSYLGRTDKTVKDDAYFCYAAARLSGFVWDDGGTIGDDPSKVLYTIRLGEPLTGLLYESGVDYRFYDHGLIAMNGGKEKLAVDLPMPSDVRLSSFRDLYNQGTINARGKSLKLEVPGESGRVYISR